jgi:hypothetical protein
MTVQGWIYFVPCSHRYYALPFSWGLFHFHFYVISVCYTGMSVVFVGDGESKDNLRLFDGEQYLSALYSADATDS